MLKSKDRQNGYEKKNDLIVEAKMLKKKLKYVNYTTVVAYNTEKNKLKKIYISPKDGSSSWSLKF